MKLYLDYGIMIYEWNFWRAILTAKIVFMMIVPISLFVIFNLFLNFCPIFFLYLEASFPSTISNLHLKTLINAYYFC